MSAEEKMMKELRIEEAKAELTDELRKLVGSVGTHISLAGLAIGAAALEVKGEEKRYLADILEIYALTLDVTTRYINFVKSKKGDKLS